MSHQPIPRCELCQADIEPHRRNSQPPTRFCADCFWKHKARMRTGSQVGGRMRAKDGRFHVTRH